MTGPWKRLTLGETGYDILVNTALFESVRLVAGQTRIYPQHATPNVYLWVREPFELVAAMLTEQPDSDDPARE